MSFELNYGMYYLKNKGFLAWIEDNKLVVTNGDRKVVLQEVVDDLFLVVDCEPYKACVGKVFDLDQIPDLLTNPNPC